MLRKIFALIKKDFLNETSYAFSLFFNIFGVLVSLLSYYFIDKLFGFTMAGQLKEFGVNYFSYVLLSMAFFSYIGVGVGSFSARIQSEQMQGTLESLLLSPTKTYTILLSMGLWNLLLASMDVIIYLVLGIFFFKIDFGSVNILSAMIVLILTIISFSGLGMLSASFIIVFKRGNPFGWIVGTMEGLLGGVYFPITVMPAFLQVLAKCLPVTYAVRAMQFAVYKGYSLYQLRIECGFLVLFSIILIPLSLYSFRYALKRARMEGSLAQY